MGEEKIPIINIMEEIVDLKVDKLVDIKDMCKCQHCRADAKALALNKLPPRYVASVSGGVFSQMQATTTQMQAELMVAVVEAVEMVAKRPSHAVEKKEEKKKERRLSTRSASVEKTVQMENLPQDDGVEEVGNAQENETIGQKQAATVNKISAEDIGGETKPNLGGKISPEDIGGTALTQVPTAKAAQESTVTTASEAPATQSQEDKMAAALAAAKAKAAQEAAASIASETPIAQSQEDKMAAALAAAKAKAVQEAAEEDELIDVGGYGAFDGTELPEL